MLYHISNFIGFRTRQCLVFLWNSIPDLIVLGLSVITSRLSEKNKILTQELRSSRKGFPIWKAPGPGKRCIMKEKIKFHHCAFALIFLVAATLYFNP